MKIISMTHCSVEIEHEQRHRSTVFLHGNNRWRCLRCHRLRCIHARWVAEQNPTLPKAEPELSDADMADLIDG